MENYRRVKTDQSFKELLVTRAKIIRAIREFFWSRDFIETDTPCLVDLPGQEPYLDVFKTELFLPASEGGPAQKKDMYLITSPEYAMKKLLAGGFKNIFQITKSFRNSETKSGLHNPEFTILEWYRAHAGYEKIMEDCESLFKFIFDKIFGEKERRSLIYRGETTKIDAPFERLKVCDAFEKYANVPKNVFEDEKEFKKLAKSKGYKVDENTSFDDAFFLIFLNEIENKLGRETPTILYEYPINMAALSRVCPGNNKYAERFEICFQGIELCNAFGELTDWREQERRLTEERGLRIKLNKQIYDVDQSFIDALKFGMPEAAGIALGVDRLVMIFTGAQKISDVTFFPYKNN